MNRTTSGSINNLLPAHIIFFLKTEKKTQRKSIVLNCHDNCRERREKKLFNHYSSQLDYPAITDVDFEGNREEFLRIDVQERTS